MVAAGWLLGTMVTGCILPADTPPPPPEPEPEAPVAPPPSACIEVLPGVLDLGERPPGSLPLATGAVVVRNGCEGVLEIGELFLSGAPTIFALVDPPELPLSVAPLELVTFGVQATPETYGTFTDFLTIATNDPLRPDTIVGLQIDAVCDSAAEDVDTDRDTIPDGCDTCPTGDDRVDLDQDGAPDACDLCPGFDDSLDDDGDTIPDACDICPVGDDRFDSDGDGIPNDCDRCVRGPDFEDADGDTVPDACDDCDGGDDRVDLDNDGTPDDCDACPGALDFLDVDQDGVPDGCDVCPEFDDTLDADTDTIPDGCDRCPGGDDTLDADSDTVPDGCDRCPGGDDTLDADADTVPDGCDVCAGADDTLDADGDAVPDACDICPTGDDALDADTDTVPDACDRCPGADDSLDADSDAIPDACDACPGADDALDADADAVPDDCDVCPGADDNIDDDGDDVPDGCDTCPGFDDAPDADGDGVADGCDVCPGADDTRDTDNDGLPNACDPCVQGPQSEDADGDGVADACDACPGADDNLDADNDGVADACDACPGADDTLDLDLDTIPDACDVCFGRDDRFDDDLDGIPDGCDRCPRGDDSVDGDADGVPDACDRCSGFDDSIDVDFDGFPDRSPDCDPCVGASRTLTFPQTPAPKVDFLFVVEDTTGMGPRQTSLAAAFPDFATALASANLDWRIAVITAAAPQLRGPVITASPNAAAEFSSQVLVGENGFASPTGIQQAYDATQPGGSAGPGTSFLRADATLSVVFVSDGFDQSMVSPDTVFDYWVGLKGGDADQVQVHGFVGLYFNSAYRTLVGFAGGLEYNIWGLQPDWGTEVADIAAAVAPTLVFPLPSVPARPSLVVREDGTVSTRAVYDASNNLVRFSNVGLPGVGSVITIDYVEDCEGVVGGCADGLDNDGDGRIDWPDDPGCLSANDTNETDPFFAPGCTDGLDNDGDGRIDYPADPECSAAAQESETCRVVASDAFGYQACRDPGFALSTCPDLSASPPLPLGDEGTVSVPLGFDFDFYGTPRSSVFVGANGTLSFGSPWSPSANQCLDDADDETILAWWDDLNPAGGQVWTRTSGTAPHRVFDVHWRVPPFGGGGLLDIRASLREGTNDIDLCYIDTVVISGISLGASATTGIRGPGGLGIETSCFDATLQQGLVFRFASP